MGSYTSQRANLTALAAEAVRLYRSRSANVPGHVRTVLGNLRKVEECLQERYGLKLSGLDILDIGSGQFLLQLIYFARANRVAGIDWDIIALGINPLPYLRMVVSNGPWRAAKTVGRKLLGIDRRYREELMAQLNLTSLPKPDVYRMDACRMAFGDASFDFVHSYSVFHHLSDPAAGIAEVVRTLRPGGVAYIAFHLFTSENGCLDPTVFRDDQGSIVRWPHLRESYAGKVAPNAYLNKLRLVQWRELFQSNMPGSEFILTRAPRGGAEDDAKSLLSRGELAGYSLEELLVHDMAVLWRKPL